MLTTEDLESSQTPGDVPDSDAACGDTADSDTRRIPDVAPRATTPTENASTETGPTGWFRNVETLRTAAASIVIACFAILTLASLLPESETSTAVDRLIDPAVRATGTHQDWGVFSPNPSQFEGQTYAVVYFEDGNSTEWKPRPNNVLDSTRSERWRKWEARAHLETHEAYWPVTAEFIANQYADAPSPVARIRLTRRWAEDVPLTKDTPDEREFSEFQFFEWNPSTSTGTPLTFADQLTSEPSS